ncbi:non-ribosomal peptide synthetase, partial [Thermodesulfobacteriota bacterium]
KVHRAVVNFLTTMGRVPGMSEQDVLVAVTTLSFDIHVLEIYLPLIIGAKVVIASREVASDGTQLLETLTNSNATVMQATPSTWRLLLAADWKGSDRLKILCGGEVFPRDLVKELISRAASVWNMYGPTETTVWSTCYKLKNPDDPVLIGKPIGNTTCYILDKRMQPVPIGVPGELHIGGDGVTRGYLKRPNLTAKQFVSDRFSGDPEARIYKTGDLVRYRPDGNIEYLNRIDNQVKVRGFRIELGEIETVMTEHDAVAQGIVTVKEARPGDARLIAFVVTLPGHDLTVTELRRHLRGRLPEYMIPNHMVEIDALPLTPAGKIDRKGMPAPFSIGGDGEDEYVAPSTESEVFLAKMWQEVLGTDRVSVHDNFFDIGGHSLLSMQVLARIKKETGLQLSPRVMLLNTLGQIAEEYPLKLPSAEPGPSEDQENFPQGFFGQRIMRKIKDRFQRPSK